MSNHRRVGSSPISRTKIGKHHTMLADFYFFTLLLPFNYSLLPLHDFIAQPPAENLPTALFTNAKQIGFEAGLALSSSPAVL